MDPYRINFRIPGTISLLLLVSISSFANSFVDPNVTHLRKQIAQLRKKAAQAEEQSQRIDGKAPLLGSSQIQQKIKAAKEQLNQKKWAYLGLAHSIETVLQRYSDDDDISDRVIWLKSEEDRIDQDCTEIQHLLSSLSRSSISSQEQSAKLSTRTASTSKKSASVSASCIHAMNDIDDLLLGLDDAWNKIKKKADERKSLQQTPQSIQINKRRKVANLKAQFNVIQSMYQAAGARSCSCDFDKLVDVIEKVRTQMVSSYYYSQGESIADAPAGEGIPCNVQITQKEGQGEELVIFPCSGSYAGGGFKRMSLALSYDDPKIIASLVIDGTKADVDREVNFSRRFKGVGIASSLSNAVKIGSSKRFGNATYLTTQEFYDSDLQKELSKLREADRYRIAYEILQGLNTIHSQNVVHRDLKPGNIFLKRDTDGKFHAGIADFGLAEEAGNVTGHAGTTFYMPPNAYSDAAVKKSLDSWAMGLMFLELFKRLDRESLSPIVNAKKVKTLDSYEKINKVFKTNCPVEVESLDGLICRLLNPNAEERMPADQALAAFEKICATHPSRCQ